MKYVVDRIDENIAVIEADDGTTYSIPIGLLPAGAGEGAVVSITLEREEERKRKKAASQLMKKVWKD